MRRVYIEVKFHIVIDVDEGIEVSDVMASMACQIDPPTEFASVMGYALEDYEITGSK
jgi:hypothetical protein